MRLGIIIICLAVPRMLFSQQEIIDNGYEKGLSKDGYKVGVWEYYEDSALKLQVDYDKNSLVYLAPDTAQYSIRTENGWEMSELDTPPRYVGSMEEVIEIFSRTVSYPAKARRKSVIGTVIIGFEVNLGGNIENVQMLKGIGAGCDEEVLNFIREIPDFWLVAAKDGKKYRSRYILTVRFRIGIRTEEGDKWDMESKKEQRERSEIIANSLPAKVFEEFVVSAIRFH